MAEETTGAAPVAEAGPRGTALTENAAPEGEAKGAEGTALTAEAEGAEGEAKGAEGAPETYEEFTLPEGVEVDKDTLESVKGLAKELNLSQEAAQKIVDFQANQAKELADQTTSTWDKMRTDWLKDAKADKEIGGKNFEPKVELGKRALKQFGANEDGSVPLREVLEAFSLGNHPEMIRFFARVGEALGDDTIVGGKSGGAPKSAAERIFGSTS